MEKHIERVHCTYSFIDICIFHLYEKEVSYGSRAAMKVKRT